MRFPGKTVGLLGIASCIGATGAAAVRLEIDSATIAASGDTASVCVYLDSEGVDVAGTQNNIRWDPGCITPVAEGCRTSPRHSKTAYTMLHEHEVPPRIATLVVSLSESGPIGDGELYCCNFTARLDAPGDCCAVMLSNPISASPAGEGLTTYVPDLGAICLDPEATPRPPVVPDTRTPTWTPSPVPWNPTETPTATSAPTEAEPTTTPRQSGNAQAVADDDSDDSCQVTRGNDATGLAVLMLLPPVLVWRRRQEAR